MLERCQNYSHHDILRFYVHDPNKAGVNIPKYLNISIVDSGKGKKEPFYGDANLLDAFEKFLTRLGKLYDGDKRIFAIQAGLLGVWGE